MKLHLKLALGVLIVTLLPLGGVDAALAIAQSQVYPWTLSDRLIVFVMMTSLFVSGPLEDISRCVAQIGGDRLDAWVDSAGARGEVASLVRSINRMTERLRTSAQQKDQTIAGLEAELHAGWKKHTRPQD